jgi:hypothetical protein
MNDPDAIEVNEEMSERALLVIRLEKSTIPVDTVEKHEALGGGNVDETSLKKGR